MCYLWRRVHAARVRAPGAGVERAFVGLAGWPSTTPFPGAPLSGGEEGVWPVSGDAQG